MVTFYFATLLRAGIPVLHVISILAVLIFAVAGAYIYRNRRQLFDRDPQMPAYQDTPAIRHIRVELVAIIWGTLMLVTLATLCAIWLW